MIFTRVLLGPVQCLRSLHRTYATLHLSDSLHECALMLSQEFRRIVVHLRQSAERAS